MKNIYFIGLTMISVICFSQTKVKDTITRKAKISTNQKSNLVNFQAEVPTLNQILGAPKANYSYFWEMGDGSYSKEPTPKKAYKKKGDYIINLSVTNNYDNGKPPKTRPKTVAITDVTDTNYDHIASLKDTISLALYANRDPVPDEEMIVMISYKNELNYLANGKLYLFYNDTEFKNKNFELLHTRTHFGEKEIVTKQNIAAISDYNNSSQNIACFAINLPFIKNVFSTDENLEVTLAKCNLQFADSKIFEFDAMDANETRNMFFTFKTTPEMLKDTSATVKMRSVFVPDRNYKNHKTKTLEMEIVTSHDPNNMSSNATLMNYRLVRFKNLKFKTRFQNNGEGPARIIRLETDTPDMFDKKTLQIVDSYPKCPICPKNELVNYSCLDTIIKQKQIHFTFKNIYIPGSNQKNVTEKDSTKGFVKYTMKFAKDFHKIKTKSQTAIIFDKNEPVITNFATTRFKPGLSIGARVGYNLYSDQKDSKSYFVGATLSPYKSYRWYWQAEIMANRFEIKNHFEGQISRELVILPEPIFLENGQPIDAAYVQSSSSSQLINTLLEVVPISIRYNINNYISIGVGPQISLPLFGQTETENNTKFYQPNFGTINPPPVGPEIVKLQETTSNTLKTKAFESIQTSFFADITLGFARIGPSLGARFYKSIEENFDYWQFYAIWKF